MQNTSFDTSHPDFKYRPSQNPYWQKLHDLPDGAHLDHRAESYRGRWLNEFPEEVRTRLHVEIGCNGGHVTLGLAKRTPGEAFIGLDWKFKQIFLAQEKAKKRELPNALFVRGYAERLPFLFAPGEIDQLSLYFPDPWPKKAQKKNRYIAAEWLKSVAPLLKPDGGFEIRTDHLDYFEFMLEQIELSGRWTTLEKSFDVHADNPARLKLEIPDVTLFEKIFIRDGIPIKRVLLTPLRSESQ